MFRFILEENVRKCVEERMDKIFAETGGISKEILGLTCTLVVVLGASANMVYKACNTNHGKGTIFCGLLLQGYHGGIINAHILSF